MHVMKAAAIALLALGAAACASGPAYSAYESSIPALKQSEGRLWFYRTATFVGGAVQPDVKINGETAGKSTGGGFFFADRAPGQYVVSASTEAQRNLSVSLAAGEQKYIRMDPQMGVMVGTIKLVLVEPEVGKTEIQKTKFSGPSAAAK